MAAKVRPYRPQRAASLHDATFMILKFKPESGLELGRREESSTGKIGSAGNGKTSSPSDGNLGSTHVLLRSSLKRRTLETIDELNEKITHTVRG